MDETTVETWEQDGMRLWLFEDGKRTGVYLDVHYTGIEWAEKARPIPAAIISDHANAQQVTALRKALESIRADNQHLSRNWITANAALEALSTGTST